jgi:hypothetical protein
MPQPGTPLGLGAMAAQLASDIATLPFIEVAVEHRGASAGGLCPHNEVSHPRFTGIGGRLGIFNALSTGDQS